ncbi:Ger(x)C family spore germination protein [Bacillus inaquosorum]|uniref:Ger(x)C family spore germination protein n=1 Tax=Bacillus inaquosorum TaxID=483913 RepID=UPI00227F0309|nr:Ger(x)C family spore germination protein [Bacillus inaquosorum]MCY8071929.1 Ger(x)C family spore germination protein [Bacillus inaquosorum]MCY9379749.1 Ger(x)C family spore germination protein [Bacillus inaquosorum]
MKSKIKHPLPAIVILCLLMICVTGCWSSREIEELGLTFAIAIDKGKETNTEKELKEEGGSYPKKDNITLTYQFVNEKAAGAGTSSGDGGGQGAQKAYINISETGDSLQQIGSEIALRRDREVFSPHLKVVVMSEDVLRTYPIDKMLDQFFRDNEIRLSCLVLSAKGEAREALQLKESGEIPAFRLVGLGENEHKVSRILPPVTLAKLIGKLHSDSSFLLQNVVAANGAIKYSGAAVINGKSKKMIGTLNEYETEGITWIAGEGKGGVVKSYDKKSQQVIAYDINYIKSKIKPVVKGTDISFHVDIESEGDLVENWNTKETLDTKFLERIETNTENEVKKIVGNVLKKLQDDYKADVAGFDESLRLEHPDLWKKVENNWDDTFSKATITYSVKATITHYGTVKTQQ